MFVANAKLPPNSIMRISPFSQQQTCRELPVLTHKLPLDVYRYTPMAFSIDGAKLQVSSNGFESYRNPSVSILQSPKRLFWFLLQISKVSYMKSPLLFYFQHPCIKIPKSLDGLEVAQNLEPYPYVAADTIYSRYRTT